MDAAFTEHILRNDLNEAKLIWKHKLVALSAEANRVERLFKGKKTRPASTMVIECDFLKDNKEILEQGLLVRDVWSEIDASNVLEFIKGILNNGINSGTIKYGLLNPSILFRTFRPKLTGEEIDIITKIITAVKTLTPLLTDLDDEATYQWQRFVQYSWESVDYQIDRALGQGLIRRVKYAALSPEGKLLAQLSKEPDWFIDVKGHRIGQKP